MDYEVSTFSGDITNCMGKEAERVSKYGPGRRLNGTRGAPGSDEAKVRLKTMSGDVECVTRLERWAGRGPPPLSNLPISVCLPHLPRRVCRYWRTVRSNMRRLRPTPMGRA